MTDLFNTSWRLADLDPADVGPYSGVPFPGDAEKDRVWKDYYDRRPARVPMLLETNERVALLDDRLPHHGLDFRKVFEDAKTMALARLLHQYVIRRRYHRFCDRPAESPETWHIGIGFQNVFEAWFFGCPVRYYDDQVPDTAPILDEDNKRAVFDVDISRPLDRAPFSLAIEYYEFLTDYLQNKTFLDKPIAVDLPTFCSTDGPLTVAMNVRGPAILMDLAVDPEYAHDLFAFFIQAAVLRRKAFVQRFGLPETPAGLADDSIALIGIEQYREHVMPHHRRWYEEAGDVFGRRSIHLCGDASRFFPILKDELGVTSFDTGFPVPFGDLRRRLGPDVEILGGVEVGLLRSGSPGQIYARSREILTSGIKEGGRFIFREGNNLPPGVPWENLAAMYKAALDYGQSE